MSYVNLQIKSYAFASLFNKYQEDFEGYFDYSAPLQIHGLISVFEFDSLSGVHGMPSNLSEIIPFITARLSNDEITCKDDLEDIEDIDLPEGVKNCLIELLNHENDLLISVDKLFFGCYQEQDDGYNSLEIVESLSFIFEKQHNTQRPVSASEGEQYLSCLID